MEQENLSQKEPIEQRAELLEANCKAIEEEHVKRYFTSNELTDMKADLSDISITEADREDELKALSAGLKLKIKELRLRRRQILVGLKNKYEEKIEEVYLFDDQENGKMNYYNSHGEFIRNRKLTPEEKQTRIVNFNSKTA